MKTKKNKSVVLKKPTVIVRSIDKSSMVASKDRTNEQRQAHYESVFDLVKRVQKTRNDRDSTLLYNIFLPLIKTYVKKFYPRISSFYEYDDFVSDVNCMFFQLVKEYDPDYNAAKFFAFYMKFMLGRRIMAMIKEMRKKPDYNIVDHKKEVFELIPYHDTVDDNMFVEFFWKKVKEESSHLPKGKQFMKKYFFSDTTYTLKDLSHELDENMYTVFFKLKSRLKKYFNGEEK